jgi:hypothetical protein
MSEPKWKTFERVVYELQRSFSPHEATVTPNDHISGHDSGTDRQVDVSIRMRVANYDILIVIDCKDCKVPVDLKDVDAFDGLLRDVRANKGVLISSSGFTRAAVESAKAHGIDTLRYIDTESVDWKSYAALPALLERTYLKGFRLMLSPVPGYPLCVPSDADVRSMRVGGPDGKPLGTIGGLIAAKWNKQDIPHAPGVIEVVLGDHLTIECQGQVGHVGIKAELHVAQTFYFGPLPLKVKGFRDEQTGSLTTKDLATEWINPSAIETGAVKGWQEVADKNCLSVRPVIALTYSDVLPADARSA